MAYIREYSHGGGGGNNNKTTKNKEIVPYLYAVVAENMPALTLVRWSGWLIADSTLVAGDFDWRLLIKRDRAWELSYNQVLEFWNVDKRKKKEHKFLAKKEA